MGRFKCAFPSPQSESSKYDNGPTDKNLGEANEPPAGSCRNRHFEKYGCMQDEYEIEKELNAFETFRIGIKEQWHKLRVDVE
jgi:hypothetical protein